MAEHAKAAVTSIDIFVSIFILKASLLRDSTCYLIYGSNIFTPIHKFKYIISLISINIFYNSKKIRADEKKRPEIIGAFYLPNAVLSRHVVT
jgi:hypothetical protein